MSAFGLFSNVAYGHAEAPTIQQILSYPFVSDLVRSEAGNRVAWVETLRGVRTIWVADASRGAARRVFSTGKDDGQEITGLSFLPNACRLLFVRGGAHEGNWEAEGRKAPDPTYDVTEPKVTMWIADISTMRSAPIAEGDGAVISQTGQVAFVKDGQVWTLRVPDTGHGRLGKAERLFFDKGQDDGLVWSPDGSRLAFVSNRGSHSFIGVWEKGQAHLRYLVPSTNQDSDPSWSEDGRNLAWVRQPGTGGVPHNFLTAEVRPFSVWSAPVNTWAGRPVWEAPDTPAGNLPEITAQEPLFWTADRRLVFLAETDGWPHLWSVDGENGGDTKLLTPGAFMVEDVAMSPDRRSVVFSANTGAALNDEQRRHIYRLDLAKSAPQAITQGEQLQWAPLALERRSVALVEAGPQQTPRVAIQTEEGAKRILKTVQGSEYPVAALVVPRAVNWKAPDGLEIEGQLFQKPELTSVQPGMVYVHGGPHRQMLLGWHMMDVYASAYALNEWLALNGYTVLSINYRCGIGYGRSFEHPEHAGAAGASEYQDVVSGARLLQRTSGVDATRVGIYGASYGGYLTGLALARNSDTFKAGADWVGIWNWLAEYQKDGVLPDYWWQIDPAWQTAAKVAVMSSPVGSLSTWRSPVLLVHGDDDRNVQFEETGMAADALQRHGVRVEELVLPNETHSIKSWRALLKVDEDTAAFFANQLK